MDTALEARAVDPLSQLLSLVRVRSTVYCRSLMRAPWGFRVVARPVAGFHLVTQGSGWLEVEDEPRYRVKEGDLVILPRGSAHQLRSDLHASVRLLDDILVDHPAPDGRLIYGGDGQSTGLLCGGFELDEPRLHPLLSRLPAVIRVEGKAGKPTTWLAMTVELLMGEMTAAYPGVESLVTRLSEVLLLQALRTYLADLNGSGPAWLQGFRDPQIGKAIALLQEHPDQPWTLGKLATTVAMSRAAFTARFRQLTGEPPMRYLTRYRLFRAALELRRSNATLARIAQATGYDSEASFSKAFRRTFGLSPGSYRKREANGS